MVHLIKTGPVVVLNFSGVYDHERFAKRPGIVRVDCRHLDKDVLSPLAVMTNWDQGHFDLEQTPRSTQGKINRTDRESSVILNSAAEILDAWVN